MARTSKGEIQPDPTRFPPTAAGANDGMTAVIAYVHSKNLSFGLYTAGGTAGCMKSRAGSRGHWVQDAKSFAAWGVDYVKMDWCGGEDVHGSYGNMSKALNATGVSRRVQQDRLSYPDLLVPGASSTYYCVCHEY